MIYFIFEGSVQLKSASTRFLKVPTLYVSCHKINISVKLQFISLNKL